MVQRQRQRVKQSLASVNRYINQLTKLQTLLLLFQRVLSATLPGSALYGQEEAFRCFAALN